ncbi:Asi2 [Kluyveromyces lactis]|nr:Asi2 [Kluyveromyces lactis]
MNNDDELYEQFQYEMEHGTPHPNVVDPRELEELLQQLENEQEQVFLRRNVRPRNAPVHWPDFVVRRPYLRFLLRNLLILDHILMVLFLPFSLFTVLKTVINQVTFSDTDVFTEVIDYVHNRQVVDPTSSIVYLYRNGAGLLGCFHNSAVYHSAPCFKYLMKIYENPNVLRQLYTIYIKWYTVTVYLGYGIFVSSYLSFVTFFFVVCVTLLFIKKFKGVDVIIANILQTCNLVF